MSVAILNRVMNMQTALTLRAVLSVPVGQDFLDTDSTVLVSLHVILQAVHFLLTYGVYLHK